MPSSGGDSNCLYCAHCLIFRLMFPSALRQQHPPLVQPMPPSGDFIRARIVTDLEHLLCVLPCLPLEEAPLMTTRSEALAGLHSPNSWALVVPPSPERWCLWTKTDCRDRASALGRILLSSYPHNSTMRELPESSRDPFSPSLIFRCPTCSRIGSVWRKRLKLVEIFLKRKKRTNVPFTNLMV